VKLFITALEPKSRSIFTTYCEAKSDTYEVGPGLPSEVQASGKGEILRGVKVMVMRNE
jgi:hypothetical protein